MISFLLRISLIFQRVNTDVRLKLYFFGMKSLTGLFLFIGLVSCTDTPSRTPEKARFPRDTAIVKKEPANPYAGIDVSPMDMSYLPVDYPKLAERKSLPVARVIYSRPHKQGRVIFGGLLKYGERWRLGANEASEIEFFQPVIIQGKTIPRGKFIIYCIPQPDHWTIVLNGNLYSWGLNLDPSKDLYKFEIPVQTRNQSVEYFSMVFQSSSPGTADLVMAWDNIEARLPVQYKEK